MSYIGCIGAQEIRLCSHCGDSRCVIFTLHVPRLSSVLRSFKVSFCVSMCVYVCGENISLKAEVSYLKHTALPLIAHYALYSFKLPFFSGASDMKVLNTVFFT